MVRNSLIPKPGASNSSFRNFGFKYRLRSQQFALHVAMGCDDQIRSHLETREKFRHFAHFFFTKIGQRRSSSDFFQSGNRPSP